MKTWYEVYETNNERGSHTIMIYDTLKSARKFKKMIQNSNYGKYSQEVYKSTFHIDKWQDIENPTKIQEIK